MPDFVHGLGLRIREWRYENNITRHDLSQTIKYSEKAIQNWETGKAMPSYDAIIALSITMGVSIDWLLGQSCTWRKADYFVEKQHFT